MPSPLYRRNAAALGKIPGEMPVFTCKYFLEILVLLPVAPLCTKFLCFCPISSGWTPDTSPPSAFPALVAESATEDYPHPCPQYHLRPCSGLAPVSSSLCSRAPWPMLSLLAKARLPTLCGSGGLPCPGGRGNRRHSPCSCTAGRSSGRFWHTRALQPSGYQRGTPT